MSVFAGAFDIIFLAEMGDKSQISVRIRVTLLEIISFTL